MHKTHVGSGGPTPTEQRRKMSGPMTLKQHWFIRDLLAEIDDIIDSAEPGVTFTEAGDLIGVLKSARHTLTHQPKAAS